MTREEAIDWLCRLKRQIKIFMPYLWQKSFEDALDVAIKALERESCCNCIEFKRYSKEMGFEIEEEPKIKVLDRDEVARKLGTVDIYKANAWITLLKDLEYLGMKICEVEE